MFTEAEWQAVRLSILVSTTAVIATLPLAIAISWFIAKKRFPGRALIEIAINMPLVMPPVVTGYLLLLLFGRQGPLGIALESILGLRFIFDWKGAALASAIVGFPLLVRPIKLAFENVDDSLLKAANTLGASAIDTFWTIAMPLASPGILAGCVLAFARSMGEFGATVIVAGNIPGQTQTISLRIYSLLDAPDGIGDARGLVVASIIVAASALLIGEALDRFQRRRVNDDRN